MSELPPELEAVIGGVFLGAEHYKHGERPSEQAVRQALAAALPAYVARLRAEWEAEQGKVLKVLPEIESPPIVLEDEEAAERARAEPAEPPEGLKATVETALPCKPCAAARRWGDKHTPNCPALQRPAVLAALARFRWRSAAEELRLRAGLERVVDECSQSDNFGSRVHAAWEAAEAALATQSSPDAEALAELAALPGEIEAGAHLLADSQARADRKLAGRLAALLRRAGLEPKEDR